MGFTFCQSKKQDAPVAVNAAQQQPAIDSIKLKEYSVHLVKLPFTYVIKDEKGAKKQYDRAWLVKLEFEKIPKLVSLTIDFAIGDYIIPEYGGWKKGIYFKIYQTELLESLNNQEILYRLPDQDNMISTKQVFNISAYKTLKIEDERELLKKDN